MALGDYRRAVGIFPTREQAERAVTELRTAGFEADDISVVARDQNPVAGADAQTKVGEGASTGATAGGVLGGLTGLLVGIGALAIPGIGPVITAGALGTALATTAAGAGIGAAAGGLVGALVGLGIPEDRARTYQSRIERGEYLVMAEGSRAEVDRAEAILRRGGIEDFDIYDAPEGSYTLRNERVDPNPRVRGY